MKRFLICLLLAACTGGRAVVATTPNLTRSAVDLKVKYGEPPLNPVSFMESEHPPAVVIKKVGHTAILHLTGYNAVVLASNQPWIGQVTCTETNGIVANGRNTRCVFRRDTFVYVLKAGTRY
jgi:hypothetical protein